MTFLRTINTMLPGIKPFHRCHAFQIFSFKQEISLTAQFIRLVEFSRYTKFHKNPFETRENMGPQTSQFLHEIYGRRQPLPPATHLFVKIAKFGVPYFHEFQTDSYETLPNYLIRNDKLIYAGGLLIYLCEKYEKLLVLRDIDKKAHYSDQDQVLLLSDRLISLLLSFSHDKTDMFLEFRRSIFCRKRIKARWIELLLDRKCS